MVRPFFRKCLIIISILASFLYGWWQGYNAGWEDNEKYWEEEVERTELKI